MASVTYTCSFSSALAFNAHPSASLNGPSAMIPDGAVITNVGFEVYCGVSTYNYSADCNATLTDGSGNTITISGTCKTGSESRIWASWSESISATDSARIAWNNLSTVALSGTDKLTVRTGYTATLTITYVEYSPCGAPTNVSLSSSTSEGANVTISWGAGTAGNFNAVTGYEVQRAASSDGSTWGSWAALKTTTATSLSVSPPAAYGDYYKYRVRTQGAAGSAYYSAWTESSALRKVRPSLISYTDPDLVAGVRVKAVHITELQTNVNRLRNSLGLVSYSFTTIQAGYTSLAGWTSHVTELRTAIDEIGVSHESWIAISENKPTAAVMQQLRRVVGGI